MNPQMKVGDKINYWTILGEPFRKEDGLVYYRCKCKCGVVKDVFYYNVDKGRSKSCGCYNLEALSKRSATHGMTKTRFYGIWKAMNRRCKDKNQSTYKHYGGRGITVCDRWNKFENFKEDMYQSYLDHVSKHGEKNTSIDRIDINGNYEPSNCRWATWEEQGNNRRNCHYLEFNGKTMSIHNWSLEVNIPERIIWKRLNYGWTVEDSLTKPLRRY